MSQELNGTLTNSADLIGNISIGVEQSTDNYNDLINKPSINSVTLQGNKTTSDLLIDYNDLTNKPTIPAAQVNSDWNAVSGVAQILNKPTIINYGSELPMSSTDSNKVTDVINSICELPTVKSASGEIATFDTDISDNLIACKCDINAIQSGSGTPSPSNPRAINGYSTCTISVADSENVVQDTYPVSLGQTVYGGYLNVTTGELTITWSGVDLGTLEITQRSQGGTSINAWIRSDSIANVIKKPANNNTRANILCSCFSINTANAVYLGVNNCIGINTDGNVTFYATDFADFTSDQISAALSGKMLAYELATPTEITLTPKQIETIIGVNNVFHDCNGQTEVKYLLTIGKAISE